MALTNAKRKLDEGSHSNESYKQSRKRRHSDHAPSSAISNHAPKQPGNRHVRGVDKATQPKQAFDNTSDSSADDVPAVKDSKAGTRKAIDRKQRVSSSKSTSRNDSDVSTAEPTDVAKNVTSKVPLLASSSPPSEDAVSEGEAVGIVGDDDNDDDDEEELEYDDEDDPTSAPSSPSSPEPTSDASSANSATQPPPHPPAAPRLALQPSLKS